MKLVDEQDFAELVTLVLLFADDAAAAERWGRGSGRGCDVHVYAFWG
jgi:hypothetical protein